MLKKLDEINNDIDDFTNLTTSTTTQPEMVLMRRLSIWLTSQIEAKPIGHVK